MTTNEPTALSSAKQQSAKRLYWLAGGAIGVLSVVLGVLVVTGMQQSTDINSEVAVVQIDRCAAEVVSTDPTACPERGQFLDTLQRLQTELIPQLINLDSLAWVGEPLEAIRQLETQALSRFEQAAYIEALALVQQANEQAQQVIAQIPQVFEQQLVSLQNEFDANQVENALAAFEVVQLIDSAHPTVQAYAPRLTVLPEVITWLETAEVARIENRSERELEALDRALRLDPVRTDLQPRIAQLQQQITERRFSRAVLDSEQALAAGDTRQARQHLNTARRLIASRDLSDLAGRIAALESERRFTQWMTDALAHAEQDQWVQARAAYDQALDIDGTHLGAQQAREQANTIVEGQAALRQHLERPIRLTSNRVAAHVAAQLDGLQDLRLLSATLDQQIRSVESFLEAAKVPVNVAVNSDGLTHIEVRRVGIVGQHESKVIQLTPGEYEFEGRRPGFRSEIVRLEIPYGATDVAVTVVCREPV